MSFWVLLGLAWTLVNCSNDDSPLQTPDTITNKALELVSGTATNSEPETEEGIAAWKVEIHTDAGAEVEVYYRQDNGDLLRIDGESGPFDYDINPGNSLIPFSQAKNIGANSATSETLEYWHLRKEDSFNNQWVYTLEYSNTKVYVDAVTGSILDTEN